MKIRLFTMFVMLFTSLAFASNAFAQKVVIFPTDPGPQNGAEPSAPGEFTVQLSKGHNANNDVIVSFEIDVTSTATVGDDFTMPLTLNFPANNDAVNPYELPLPVTVLDDFEVEGDETVVVRIIGVVNGGYSIGTEDQATVVIADNDADLTVIKTVVNVGGGTAVASEWTMDVTATLPSANNFPGAESPGTAIVIAAGDYSVDESGGPVDAADYDKDLSAGCTGTIVAGGSATCTITNTYVPPTGTLTVTKVVSTGDAAPDDFMLTVDGNPVTSGASNVYPADTPLALNETVLSGYEFVSITGDAKCPDALGGTVTLAADDNITCTITNQEIPVATGSLTVTKVVSTGDAAPDDFMLTVDGNPVTSGASNVYPADTPLALNETVLSGYEFVSITGDAKCPDALGGTVTLAADDNITCTITNQEIPVVTASLTVTKVVSTGDAAPDDFMLTVDGNPVTSGASNDYPVDTPLALNETVLSGYEFVSITGDAKCPDALGGTVTLAENDNITCTITNQEIPGATGTLTVTKVVSTGDAAPDDFMLTVDGNPVTSGASNVYPADTALTLNETVLSGYEFVSITGDAKCPDALGGTVTLAADDNITCTITNQESAVVTASLTVTKVVQTGDAAPDDFMLTVDGNPVSSGVSNDYPVDTPLALNETVLSGYEFVSITGDAKCPDALGGTVTLAENDNITCTITNQESAVPTASLTVTKVVQTGDAAPDDFMLTVDGNPVSSGVSNDYPVDTPLALNETVLSGYEFVSITGDAKCPDALGGTVTLAENDNITCTITNQEIEVTASLTVTKVVESGDAAPDDFMLTVDGNPVSSGVSNDFAVDTPLALNETVLAGYQFVSITGDAKCPDALGGTVTLALNDDISCTITNVETNAALTLAKSANTVTYSLVDEVIFYSYLVTNTGNAAVPGPIVVDDDMETVTCPELSTIGNGDDNLDLDEELTCTATHTVIQADIDAGSLTNTATASGDAGSIVSNQAILTVDYALPVLTLEKSTDAAFFSVVGDVIDYEYLVTASDGPSVGPITVTDDMVTVTCPDVNTVGNADDQLDPGEQITCTGSYTVVAGDITEGSITNVATASGNAGDTVSNESTVTVDWLPEDTALLELVITAVPESFTQAGELISLSYYVENIGLGPAVGPITITDDEPRTEIICPPVDTVGNNDGNLDVGEFIICTAFLVTTLEDTAGGPINLDAVASASDEFTVPGEADLELEYTPLPIPTLSEWSMILLSFLFLLVGMTYMRRRQEV